MVDGSEKGFSGIILSGGISRRMGQCKWNLPLGNRPLLSWTVAALQKIAREIIVVKRPEQDIFVEGVRQVDDNLDYPPSALRGILAGLEASKTEWSFFCGCDMPFIQPGLIKFLWKMTPGWKGLMPLLEDGPHPLHSFYHRDLIEPIRANLEQGTLRLMGIARQQDVKKVAPEDLEGFNWDPTSFFNINTPEDLYRAEQMLAARRDKSG